jgi:hypothetical protein
MGKLFGASLLAALISLTPVHPAAAQGTVEFVVDGLVKDGVIGKDAILH